MDGTFEIPVTFESGHYVFPAELIPYGYSYKIEVDVFNTIISFERDEEQNFRAIINLDDLQHARLIDKPLLAAIARALMILF